MNSKISGTNILKIISLSLFLYLTISSLNGCGDDNTVNNNNGGGSGTLLFSLDSLAINLPQDSIFVNDTGIVISNADRIKIEFMCSTNADSINSWALFRVQVNKTDSTGLVVYLDSTQSYISQLNGQYSFNVNTTLDLYTFYLLIQLTRSQNEICFIRLKNIKIFKI